MRCLSTHARPRCVQDPSSIPNTLPPLCWVRSRGRVTHSLVMRLFATALPSRVAAHTQVRGMLTKRGVQDDVRIKFQCVANLRCACLASGCPVDSIPSSDRGQGFIDDDDTGDSAVALSVAAGVQNKVRPSGVGFV